MAALWLDDEEAAAWRAWVVLSSRVRTAVGRDLARDHRLSEAEYAVLVDLSESDEHRVRMTDLAGRLEWSRSRLSHLVGRMEARGLLSRTECPEDGRAAYAVLTPVGLAEIRRAAPSHVASVRRHFLDHMRPGELAQLRTLTEAVLGRLTPTGAPCPSESDCPSSEVDPRRTSEDACASEVECQSEVGCQSEVECRTEVECAEAEDQCPPML